MTAAWPEGLQPPDPADPDAHWMALALGWLAERAPVYLAGHEDVLTAGPGPGALAEIVRTDLEDRLAGARRAYTRLAAHLTEQGLDAEAVAATPVIKAVVVEGRQLADLAAEAKEVAAAVLEHCLFATKAGLERRIVFAEDEPDGDADGVAVR